MKPMKNPLLRWLALSALLLAGCGADQATKAWASETFKDEPRTLVPGLLELRYAENRAIAFSMLRDIPEHIRKPVIFTLAGISLSVLLGFAWTLRSRGALRMVPFALILAGAFGNLLDRIRNGYVVDFVRLHWQEAWSWPIFNLADSLISVGMALLLIQGLMEREPETDSKEKPA